MPTSSSPSKQSFAVFEAYKQAINQALTEYFDALPASFALEDLPNIVRHELDLTAEYTLGPAKRVRGALAAMVYDHLTGKQLSKAGLQLAVVMELLQSYILIVDDITDRSDFRRGKPTVHRRYVQVYEGKISEREAEQFAMYTSLVTGHLAQSLLASIDEQPANIVRALRAINDNMTITGFGQFDDIMQEITRAANKDDIIRKYALKTSHYTYINPLHAGMALAGVVDESAYDQAAKFGEAAGIAFQTHDDYLGTFGTEETGKPTTDDIKEGKLTILTEYALNHGSAEDLKTLKGYLGNPDFDAHALLKARAIFDKTGATMEAWRVAEQYADAAVEQLRNITIWSESFKEQLAELVRYSVHRRS